LLDARFSPHRPLFFFFPLFRSERNSLCFSPPRLDELFPAGKADPQARELLPLPKGVFPLPKLFGRNPPFSPRGGGEPPFFWRRNGEVRLSFSFSPLGEEASFPFFPSFRGGRTPIFLFPLFFFFPETGRRVPFPPPSPSGPRKWGSAQRTVSFFPLPVRKYGCLPPPFFFFLLPPTVTDKKQRNVPTFDEPYFFSFSPGKYGSPLLFPFPYG